MGHSKEDVVDTALGILDDYGLPGLSMRRLATTLGVQQSALYWHFASKQLLLAAMAEEILRRGPRVSGAGAWDRAVERRAVGLRDTLLAYRDGAELVSTVYAFGLGAQQAHRDLAAAVEAGGVGPADARAAATVLLHFVFGFVFSEQQYLQASSAGAIHEGPSHEGPSHGGLTPGGATGRRTADPFCAGVALVLEGVRARAAERVRH